MTFPTPTPSRSQDQDTFDAAIEAFFVYLPTFEATMNALAAAMSLNATTDTSASSNTIGTGAKTFAVTAGKSFVPGMWLVIADTAAPTTNAMFAQVTSYSGTTLVGNSYAVMGSGTKTAWTISQSAPAALEGLYALVAGAASQVFSVAPATAATHAVRSDQISVDDTNFPTYSPLTSFATTLSSGTGSFTTASATMYILRIGKKVTAFFSVTITTNGTAATSVKMSIPNAASASVSASGAYRENAVTGASGQAFISAGSSTIELTTHTNTYPGADGYVLVGEVTYVEA